MAKKEKKKTKKQKEDFNLKIEEAGIQNQGYDKYDSFKDDSSEDDSISPAKYLWDRKIFSLIWLSYCVSFPKLYTGKETYLSNLATRAVEETFKDKKIRRLIGEWELVWGVSVEQRPTSNVADATMFVAKYLSYPGKRKAKYLNYEGYGNLDPKEEYKEFHEENKTQYVISIAGTNPFSIFATLFQDLSLFKTRSWNKGEPWSKDVIDKTSRRNEPAISSGASRGLKVHLTKMRSNTGELLLDFLKRAVKDEVNEKKEIVDWLQTQFDQITEELNKLKTELETQNEDESKTEETQNEDESKTKVKKQKREIQEITKSIQEIQTIQDALKKRSTYGLLNEAYSLLDKAYDIWSKAQEKLKTGTQQLKEKDDTSETADQNSDDGFDLQKFKDQAKNEAQIEIIVAGHSLGGALAQILALALKERQNEWDKNGLCKIRVVTVGNPCFTNDKFVSRYESQLGKDSTYRFWCDMDLIPSLTNNTGKLSTIYEPDIPGNVAITTLTDILRQSIKQNKYTHISHKPAAFNGYKGKFNEKFALQYINENPEIKDYISTQITSLIFLVLFQQLQVALFLPDFVGDVLEDNFKGITKELSEALAKIVAQVLDTGGEANVKFDSFLNRFFDAFSGIPGLGAFAQFNANLLDTQNVVELTNWYLQFAYQHVGQYEQELKIKEFTKQMREITQKSEKKMKYSQKKRLE